MARLPGVDGLFDGRPFDREIIVLCIRWYLRFKLSFRDLVERMAERALSMAHTTIMPASASRSRSAIACRAAAVAVPWRVLLQSLRLIGAAPSWRD
jgi:transposase-like protein